MSVKAYLVLKMKDESRSTTCQIEVEIIYNSFGYAIIFFYQFIFAKYRLLRPMMHFII